ncbi:3-oxoacyl-[acyl-carrier-protein] reductase FabG [Betaproteobacteria bacterium]|nr:3-oxoacyl-[acyl-carrier-protein] reductase FabG [Betaproteobacteria bacterium]
MTQMTKFGLAGKVALITGGGRGIGRAIALAYAEAGATVAVTARTRSEIETVVGEITAKGGKAIAETCDVLVGDQVNELVHTVEQRLGGIDVLVNNAGGGSVISPFLDLREEEWDLHLGRNLKTVFLCSQAVGRGVAARGKGGVIVNISSVMGMGPHPLRAPYAAGKAGVIALTQTLSVELAQYGIRVNAISPGFIEVERFLKQFADYSQTVRPARLSKVPLARMGLPQDVGDLALFLASDASSYITGQVIRLDGGLVTTVFYKDNSLNSWW